MKAPPAGSHLLSLLLWLKLREFVASLRASRTNQIFWTLIALGYAVDFAALIWGTTFPGFKPKILRPGLNDYIERLGRMEIVIYYAVFLLILLVGITREFARQTVTNIKLWLTMPFKSGAIADTTVILNILDPPVLFFVTVLSGLVLSGGVEVMGVGRTLLATVFLSVTFLEIKLMAYTAATLVTAVTMATPWPRKFPLKLFLIGVGIGLLCLGYARTLGMSLPPLPFPGAFESIQSGRLAEHLAFHVFVLLGSFYLARLAVREIWIHRLERIEETMQTLNRYFSWKRVAALWTFGWREPLRSLMQRECMGLMRVHNVFVPWLISVGISAAFMVIGALDSWEFSRTRVLAILSPGLLVFGIYLAFFYVPMIFFLSISSFGSDRRDMELIAAQPLRPRDIILSKTWVYGFLLGCVCTVCMACFAWYNFPEGRISPGYFLGTIALWAAGFQVCWVSVSLGAILPSPSRLGKYTAAGIPAQGIAILVWALVPICLLIAWIAAEWLPARVYSLAPAMAAVWLLFGWLLHREATRAMEESGWARPREKIKIPTPRQAGF